MTIEREKKTALEIAAEWLGIAVVICFLLWAGLLHAQQMQGPTAMPQLNTDYYVGSVPGFYATIQSAVTRACTTSGARVVIPAGSTPSDTIAGVTGGCSTVSIEDRRVAPPAAWTWTGSGPYTLVVAGGGNPIGPLQAIQSKGSSSAFFGSAGALQDTNGNTFVKSYAGTLDSYINQTNVAAMSGDGVFNSLQTAGNWVTVNQGYNPSNGENTVCNTTGCYRTPFCCGGTAQTNPGFAPDTTSSDVRAFNTGYFHYNFSSITHGNQFDLWLHNKEPQQSGSGVEGINIQQDDVRIGSGKNQEDPSHGMGLWDVHGHYLLNQIHLTRGISYGYSQNTSKGEGDYQGYQCEFDKHGTDDDSSGEGSTCDRNQALQTGSVWSQPAAATYATGATTIAGSGFTGSPPYYYDGDYLLDVTQAGTPFYVTAHTNPNAPTPGTLTTSATFTPDNRGTQTADMANGSVPQQYNGATSSVTVTVSGLSAAPVTTQKMCVADSLNDENVTVTNVASFSGGTATFTANFRYWHPAGAVYAQGPQACKFINFMVNSPGNSKNAVRIIDASASHTLEYSAHLFGGWAPQPDGLWSTQQLVPGTVFVRDASGVVTITFPGDGISGTGLGGIEVTINATSGLPSNFFGSWDMSEVDGTSNAVVTFPTGVSGAAGSFTSTGPAYFSHLMTEVAAAQLIPGAEIVYAGNPVTNVLDGTMGLESNNMGVAAGDTLQSEGGPEPVLNVAHNEIQMVTPSAGPSGLALEGISGRPVTNYFDHEIQDATEPNYFLGSGGTHPGMTHEILASTHYATHWSIQQPLAGQGGGVLTINACPGLTSTQCSNNHNFGWTRTAITSPLFNYQESVVNWRGDMLSNYGASASGSFVKEDKYIIADQNGTPGAGWNAEISDAVNGVHLSVGLSRFGANLFDNNTGALMAVLGPLATMSAGSGPTVTLTPTAFKYGADLICTATGPQACGATGFASLTGTNNYTGGGQQNFTGGINQSPSTPAVSGTNQQSPAHCLTAFYFNVASVSDQWCWVDTIGTGATPASVLALTHTGSSTTAVSIPFSILAGTINSPLLTSVSPTLATSSANSSGTPIQVIGNFWNGSASANDVWSWTSVLGTGTNPTTMYTLGHSGSTGAATVNIPFNLTGVTQTSTTNNTTYATTNFVKNVVGISNTVTSATGGTGVTSVTCATAACTNLRGTYTVVGGAATTGVIATLVWPTTTTAYACMIVQNGGASMFALSHSVATATGMTISAGLTIVGATFAVDYQCQP